MIQKPVSKAARWLHWFSLGALVLAVLVYFAAVQLAGGSILRCVWYGVIFTILYLPGVRVTELLLPFVQGAEKLALSFSLGLGVLFLSYISFGRLTALPLWGMLVVLLPLTLWQAVLYFRRWKAGGLTCPALTDPVCSLLLLAFAGGLVVFSFQGVLSYAKPSMAGTMIYHQDMLWRTANAAAVQLGSPFMNIQTFGSQLRYHYLGDAIAGFGAMFSGVLPYEAACYYTYPFLLTAMVAGLYAAARAYGAAHCWAVWMPFAALFLNGWNSSITIDIMLDMNGIAAATALTMAMLILIFRAEQDAQISPRFYLAYGLSCLTLLMAKNLYSALLSCAVLAAVLFGLVFQRRLYKRGLALAAIGGGLFALCWQLVYRFAEEESLRLLLWCPLPQYLKTVALALPLGVALWLTGAVLALFCIKKLTFRRLVMNAAVIGGLLAYGIFHHYSASQIYFLTAACLFMWFCGLDVLPWLKKHRVVQLAAGALAVFSLVCTGVTLAPKGYNGFETARHVLGLRPEYEWTPLAVTADEEATALWLHDHMARDEMFATNRHDRDPYGAKEGIWHYLTAMSGRQAYVEGWMYSRTYGHPAEEQRRQLERVSDVIFATPDIQKAFAMARAEGIDYLVVTKWLQPEPFVGAQPVFETEQTAIYAVPEA